MRQEICRCGQNVVFEALEIFLDPGSRTASPSCDEVANRVEVSTDAVKTLIHQLRKPYTTRLARRGGPCGFVPWGESCALARPYFNRRARPMKF
jgi:hypothetical protein